MKICIYELHITDLLTNNATYSPFIVLTYLAAKYGYKTRGRFVEWSMIIFFPLISNQSTK